MQDTDITQNMFRWGIDNMLQKGYGRPILYHVIVSKNND